MNIKYIHSVLGTKESLPLEGTLSSPFQSLVWGNVSEILTPLLVLARKNRATTAGSIFLTLHLHLPTRVLG